MDITNPGMSYKGINLPEEMIEHIKELIKNPRLKKYGFKNPSEFVKSATRELILRLETEIQVEEEQVPHSVLQDAIHEEDDSDPDADGEIPD